MSKDDNNSTRNILKDKKNSKTEKSLALNERKETNQAKSGKAPSENFLAKVPDALLLGEIEELNKGFTARAAVIASMPHSKPENNEFIRKNGKYTLRMIASSDVGLPYGTIPRLLLAWITTEAIRNKSRTITLGKSLADFMRELDIEPTGGKKGTITMLREQMKRLFNTAISTTYEDGKVYAGANMYLTDTYELWWTPKDPEQPGLGESYITLSEGFFKEILKSPIPFYMEVLKALRKSPLALDIYLWLTYKNSYANNITSISWESLQAQFGANYAKDAHGKRDFKRKFLLALKKVAVVYSEAHKIQALDEGLLFIPGLPHVPKTKPTPLKTQ